LPIRVKLEWNINTNLQNNERYQAVATISAKEDY